MATDSHESASDEYFGAFFVPFEVFVILLDVCRVSRHFIAMAKGCHAHFLEGFHLFTANLHHLIQVLYRSLLILLVFCHLCKISHLYVSKIKSEFP